MLGIRRGFSSKELLYVTTKSMAPAGTIILLTGAGGVFKQVLVNSGAGAMLAEGLSSAGLPIIVFGFLAAVLIRVIQGSATVAMITAAGLTAPLLASAGFTGPQMAALVIAIASGASIMSHVNDSGFWLVKQYLGMDEKQTLRSWTVMTTILALTGFLVAVLLFYLVSV
jgi:Gnt-I system low-affinity gluconate transporter